MMINYTWHGCYEPQYHANDNDIVCIEPGGAGNASTTTVHIRNFFRDDISPKERDFLKTLLKDVGNSKTLVLDISQLKGTDSWGMDIIINLVSDVVANSGYVHIIYGDYTYYLSSLKRDLARHGTSVGFAEQHNPFKFHGKRHET